MINKRDIIGLINKYRNELNILSDDNSSDIDKEKALKTIYKDEDLFWPETRSGIEGCLSGFFTEILLEQYPELISSNIKLPEESMFQDNLNKPDDIKAWLYFFTSPNSSYFTPNTYIEILEINDEWKTIDKFEYVEYTMDEYNLPYDELNNGYGGYLDEELTTADLLKIINTPGEVRFVNGMVYRLN